ncbi:MAG TPA: peptidase domain-containing ABC transporter [Chitinophagaceae bacterium]|nr:peptidase domain-containing ABC transporter [Chitinophagaceae bacterium]
MRFPFFKQQDLMDCGPSCLRMVTSYYGRTIPINNLREIAETTRDGVTLLGIAQAAEEVGLKTAAAKISVAELDEFPLPLILHWNKRHFVVLFKIKGEQFYIADPAIGKIKLNREEFSQHWIDDPRTDPKGVALVLQPTDKFYVDDREAERKGTSGWSFLKKYILQYKKHIFKLVACLLIGSAFQFLLPYLTQAIVDRGIRDRDIQFIQLILLAQFVLFFAQIATDFLRSRILLYISTRVNLSILTGFWAKLMKLPLGFFESKKTGDIIQRINDHRRIETFITGSVLQTIFSVFNLFVFSIVLLTYNATIFLIFLAGSSLYFLWIRFFLKRRRILDQYRFSAAAKESSATMQLIYGMQEIKLNNAETLKRKEWEAYHSNLFQLSFKSLSLNQYQQAGAFFINQGKNILITYLVAIAVIHGDLSLGQMLAIQFILGQLNSPVEQLVQFIQQAQEAKISLERLNEIEQLKDEGEGTDPEALIGGRSDIHLQNLSFTYAGAGNEPVLKNIDLIIPAKKVTAIVGMSGSGKTTLLKLLLNFFERYKGAIYIGHTDLRKIAPAHWRSITGSVLQDGFIFNDTIARNIALAEEEPDPEKLVLATRIAEIDSFIEGLPLGFETRIGNEGNGISTGQKQRLLIARAVYKDPDFLFFDEATNALDANNEKAIVENLQNFFTGRTVVIAAHRLSTVINADKIVVIQNGRITEEGTHDELIRKSAGYYQLVKNQLELEA